MPLRYNGSWRASTPIPSRVYHAARDGNSGELRSCPGPSKCHVKAQSSELRPWQLINKHWVGLVQVWWINGEAKQKVPRWGHGSKYWVGQNVHLGFSIRCFQTNVLVSPIVHIFLIKTAFQSQWTQQAFQSITSLGTTDQQFAEKKGFILALYSA